MSEQSADPEAGCTSACARRSPVAEHSRRSAAAERARRSAVEGVSRVGLLCLALTLCIGAAPALASDTGAPAPRWALVVGANDGGGGTQLLRFAEEDAERIGEVFRTLGRVRDDRLHLLRSPDADTLREAFATLAREMALLPDEEAAEVLFFYSGHASRDGLLLGDTLLPFDALLDALDELPASTRIAIVDACHSGEMTRVKGAVPVDPFELRPDIAERGRGLALLTSASSHEEAQESDRLGASFFTHHLIAALRGAADLRGRGRVTLAEAYAYAYDETLRATSRTARLQHPTYAFDLRGRSDVVLTHLLDGEATQGRILFGDDGRYLIFEGEADGPLRAEFQVGELPLYLTLPEGRYLVRHRTDRGLTDYQVDVAAGTTRALYTFESRRESYAAALRKGRDVPGGRPLRLATVAGVHGGTPALQGGSLAAGPRIGLRVETPHFTLQPTFHHERGAVQHPVTRSRVDRFGLDLTLFRFVDFGHLALGAGPEIGWGRLRQLPETGAARASSTFRLAGSGVAQWSFARRMGIALEAAGGAVNIALAAEQGAPSSSGGRSWSPEARASLSLVTWW